MTSSSPPITLDRAPALRWTLFSCLAVVTLVAWRSSQRLYFDHAWQLMAVRDWIDGRTTALNWIRSADPTDLTRDRLVWSLNWPAGYNFAVAALHALLRDLPLAHRALAWLCVVLGATGWYAVLARMTSLPAVWRCAALVFIVVVPPGLYSVAEFHPEAFIYAAIPWQLCLLDRLLCTEATRTQFAAALALGLVSGGVYVFKYSAALTSLPVLAVAAWRLRRDRTVYRVLMIAVLAAAALLPVALLSAYNRRASEAINPLAAHSYQRSAHPPSLVQTLTLAAGPYLALGATEDVLHRACAKILPAQSGPDGVGRVHFWTVAAGLIGWAVLAGAMLATDVRDHFWQTAVAANAFAVVALLGIWTFNTVASSEPRHFTGIALLWFPVLLRGLHAAWSARRRFAWLAGAACVPVALGFALFGYAAARACVVQPANVIAGLRLDPSLDVTLLHSQVQSLTGGRASEVVWLCFEPRALFALGGRHLAESYGESTVNYVASRRTPIVALVPFDRPMHPSIYAVNLQSLHIDFSQPDFRNGDYQGYVRWVGPDGPERPPPARPAH